MTEQTTESPRWEPLTPEQVRERLRGLTVPWWIAGGWALDLFLGHATRAHEDVEIAVYRADIEVVTKALAGWELFIADRGTLTPWSAGEPLPTAAHELWCRERGHEAWQLEILVEERVGQRWTYRRDDAIGVHAADLGRVTADGIPFIRPEIQLLYKSASARPVDETDFITVLPHLDAAQRAFLAAGIWTTAPGHRWLQRLG